MRTTERLKRYAVMALSLMGVMGGVFGVAGTPLAQSVSPEATVIEAVGPQGEIDWSNGVIRAMGIGVPPTDSVNATYAREMAKRAARVVAYRNLLEIVQGVRVDSVTTVKNLMVKSDLIHNKVQGIVKGANVIKEREFPDGSFQLTVEMPFAGELGSTLIPPRTSAPAPLKFVVTGRASTPRLLPGDLVYTGLVVDAQGLEVQQALNPKILMEDGRVVYGAEWVAPDAVEDEGFVGYVRGLPAARSHERVIATPLVIKALRVEGENKTDLVISDADAQTLHVVPAHLKFLEKAKVLVVLE